MIPLITAALSFIGPGLLRLAEKAFAGKPKSGTEKMSWVESSARWLLETLAAGQVKLPDGTTLPADMKVSDDTLRAALETLLAQAKSSGQLTAPSSTGDLYLMRLATPPVKLNV